MARDPRGVKRGNTRPYHHGDLRKALVEASIEILREEGATALTLRSAARRVGVSHAAPKNHFGDLRGLLAAVATTGFIGLAAALAEAKRGQGAREGLVASAVAYVGFALASPGAFRAMFHPLLAERGFASVEGAPSSLEVASRAAFGELVGGVVAAQGAGVVAPGDAEGKSLAAWAMVHGLASLTVDAQLAGKGIDAAPEALARLAAGYLLDGVSAAKDASRAGIPARTVRANAAPKRGMKPNDRAERRPARGSGKKVRG